MRSPAELTELFRAKGLKVTSQRQAIFQVLHGNDAHPTADAVHAVVRRDVPAISLKTVYQTLNDLAEMGEIQLLDVGTGAARFDPNTAGHHHLVCTACGKVRDIHASFRAVQVPPAQLRGFEVTSTEVVFRGLCETCAAGR